MNPSRPLLIVITGPTASGKSALAVDVASRLGCDIVSADSRQIYRGIPIGTAAPVPAELAAVRHHFVGVLELDEYYSAARYESEAVELLGRLFCHSDVAVMCGGSMMYVDAVTDGIDRLPDISDATRARVRELYESSGLDALVAWLETIDPEYVAEADLRNPRRVAHAIEITLEAGQPYSTLRGRRNANRPFDVVKVAVGMPRDRLFDRINRRVGAMMEAGLLEEARRVYPLRHLNSLNTVGYKELFSYFDGAMPLDGAVARIAKNTRVYAKKQLTWLSRPSVRPTVWLPENSTASDVLRVAGRL